MSAYIHGRLTSQSPAAALRNLGLSPKSLMSSISHMNRMALDDIPALSLPPSRDLPHRPLIGFSKFSELPVELRLKIWDHACFLARDIDLTVNFQGELHTTHETFNAYEFSAKNSCPAVLRACKESRAIGLKHYRLSFGTFQKFENIRVSTPSTIYVNWECDRICLVWEDSEHISNHGSHSPSETFVEICRENKLRHIAFNVWQNKHWAYVDLTTKIPSLREVLLFGSAALEADMGLHWDLGLISMKTFAAEYFASWKSNKNQAWVSRLEAHRRDLVTFFELNRSGSPEDPADAGPKDLWQPPQTELGYTTINGEPELSDWDW